MRPEKRFQFKHARRDAHSQRPLRIFCTKLTSQARVVLVNCKYLSVITSVCFLLNSCSLFLLGVDHSSDLISLGLSTLLGAKSSASHLHGLLLLASVASSDQLSHLALIGSQAGHLSDDLAHARSTVGDAALAEGLVDLESVGGLAGLGHDEALVKSNK